MWSFFIQKEKLVKGLDVEDKAQRTYQFHRETLNDFAELIAAAGIKDPIEIRREHINRRVSMDNIRKYSDIYPYPNMNKH